MPPEPSLLSGVDPVDPEKTETGTETTETKTETVETTETAETTETKTEEEIRASVLAELREGVPEKAEDYAFPEIEGVEKEAIESSNVYVTMREAAHELGMKPDKWGEFVTKWASAEKAEIEAFREEQMALLGKDQAQVSNRLGTLSGALTRLLPAEEAQALTGAAVSAGVVKALERLISKQPAPATTQSIQQKDDAVTISKLMNSKEYMGYEHERDPVIVARVEKFFAEGGSLKE